MKPNAYTTMQRARSLRERHPDASPSHVAIALALATFADGPTGTMIRPGHARLAGITGLDPRTVRRAVRWLEERGEVWRVREGRRGSAACFTYRLHDDGGKGGLMPPKHTFRGPQSPDRGASGTPHQLHPSDPSGLPGPRDGEAPHPGKLEKCSVCLRRRALNEDGQCPDCAAVWASGDGEAIEALIKKHERKWQ